MITLTQLYIGLALYVNCINKDWVNLVCHHDIHCTYHNSDVLRSQIHFKL